MKRRIALILAIVMLVGTLFSVLSFAEGETAPEVTPEAESYTDVKIAYANLNYSDKIYMKFAVPVYADLPEGAVVELVVWDEVDEHIAFAYKDAVASTTAAAVADLVEAEEEKASIGGKDHLVFVYDALTAEKMTDVICVRPVITLADGKRVYGDVINYSILEYVVTAKGGFEGTPAIEDQAHLAVLDAMLDFGSLAQIYLGDGEAYLPCGFYANDELNKVFVRPVINGVAGDEVFAGFFKYEEGGYATVSAPFYDLFKLIAYKDAEGNKLADASEELDGFQVPAVDGDITLTVEYSNIAIGGALDGADYSSTVDINSTLGCESVIDEGMQYVKLSQTRLKNGCIFNMSASYNPDAEKDKGDGGDTKKYPYHGLKIVPDPDDPNGQVFKWTAANLSQVSLGGITNANRPAGFGDTIDPVITLTVKLGRHNGKITTIDVFRLRNDYGTKIPLYNADGTPQLNSDGTQKTATTKTYVSIFDTNANGNVYVGSSTSDDSHLVATLPENGMQAFAFAVDFRNETITAYAENLETGEMEFVKTVALVAPAAFVSCQKAGVPGYESFESWITTLGISAQMLCSGGNWTAADKAASVELDGVMTPVLNADGTYNPLAIQKYCEDNKAMLIDDLGLFAGDICAK